MGPRPIRAARVAPTPNDDVTSETRAHDGDDDSAEDDVSSDDDSANGSDDDAPADDDSDGPRRNGRDDDTPGERDVIAPKSVRASRQDPGAAAGCVGFPIPIAAESGAAAGKVAGETK